MPEPTIPAATTKVVGLPKLIWKPSPNFSARTAKVDLIVCHDTESPNAEGAVSWLDNPESEVSTHFAIRPDGTIAYQMVDLCDKAWACCNYNSRSVNIEMAGYAAKGYGSVEWQTMANVVAFHLHFLQIPLRWARAGVGPGFCSHYDLGAAGGGHSDPTTNAATWQQFVQMVTSAYNTGDFPAVWEAEHVNGKACSLAAH
jgi:hypothetical protein